MPGFLGGSSSSGSGGEIRFPAEFIDPVTKLRVSQPETLIDTDFEYGLQPTKWETVELVNNIPSFFSKSGDTTIPDIDAITTVEGSREITVRTKFDHGLTAGIPIAVSGTKSLTADGTYIIASTPNLRTFTYLCKENQPDSIDIFDLYTAIITGEFFQGSQVNVSATSGIVTDGLTPSSLTITTDNDHGFGDNSPFYFLNLNSSINQPFDSSNSVSKSFDASNNAAAKSFDGSNTANGVDINLQNKAFKAGATTSPIAVVTPVNDSITVSHTTTNFVGYPKGTPLYYNVAAATGYFASNPRGIVYLNDVSQLGTNFSTFDVSATPNGPVVDILSTMTGYFVKADLVSSIAGNNQSTSSRVTMSLLGGDVDKRTWDASNSSGFKFNVAAYSGTDILLTTPNGDGNTLNWYVGQMVLYETTGNAASGLANNTTYWVTSIANGNTIRISESATSNTNISVSGGSGTQSFKAIGVSLDRDWIHIKDHGFKQGDMVRYDSTSATLIATSNTTETYWFVTNATTHNFQVVLEKGGPLPGLYVFSTATFSSNGNYGRYGYSTSIASARAAVGNPAWASSYLVSDGPYQKWTVPATGTYRITSAGCGDGVGWAYGAVVTQDFDLVMGETLIIGIGTYGQTTGGSCCGGNSFNGNGGSGVARGSSYTNATPLIIGGGSGGTASYSPQNTAYYGNANNNPNGQSGYNYAGNSSSNGNGGGRQSYWNGGGGGFYNDGDGSSWSYDTRGRSFRNGGEGGGTPSAREGGFGMGGGCGGHSCCETCGGGGYSGGWGGAGSSYAGGGGSYSQKGSFLSTGWNNGLGYVTIARQGGSGSGTVINFTTAASALTSSETAAVNSLTKTNVNLPNDYIYFSNLVENSVPVASEKFPTIFQGDDAAIFQYRSGGGSISGLTNNQYYYVKALDAYSARFQVNKTDTTGIDLTAITQGTIHIDFPSVYNNKIQIAHNYNAGQALKYRTDGATITGLTEGRVYFARPAEAETRGGETALYTFSNDMTFTTVGNSGRGGPNLNQMRSSYSAQGSWVNDTNYLNNIRSGTQVWTVPRTGTYRIDAYGAQGGGNNSGNAYRGAPGARVRGDVFLNAGEKIRIMVGQRGETGNASYDPHGNENGGGGGTFVMKDNDTPIIVAGGGGGAPSSSYGFNCSKDESVGYGRADSTNGVAIGCYSYAAGGSDGYGGGSSGSYQGGGGAGYRGNGANGGCHCGCTYGGQAYVNGGLGSQNAGSGCYGGNHYGGFGGGGGGCLGGPGGAGGYSGGAGGGGWSSYSQWGGGGGSYIDPAASNTIRSNGSRFGEGYVQITLVQAANLAAFTLHNTAAEAVAGTNPITISANSAASEFHAFVPVSVDPDTDRIYFPTPHGLTDGFPLWYSVTGTGIGGVTSGSATTYYVSKIDDYTIKLYSNASSPSTSGVNITTPSDRTAERFNYVVVDPVTNIFTISSHGFIADQPVRYSNGGGNSIGGLVNGAVYFIRNVLDVNQVTISQSLGGNPVDISAPGTGTSHSFVFVTVNLDENSFYLPNHGLSTGQSVVYDSQGQSQIGGLSNGSTYYVAKINDNIIKVSSNPSSQPVVDLTATGSGTQRFVLSSVNLTSDTFTIPGHGFYSGELVQYDTKGQTAIGGLTSGNAYYIIVVNGNNFRIATTPENASAGTSVNITSLGTGTHQFTSLSKTPDGIYDITSIPTTKTFKVAANGIVPKLDKTFDPRVAVNTNSNYIKLTGHGFITGTPVVYTQGDGGAPMGGLTNEETYFVHVLNKDYFSLATTAEAAFSGEVIDITSWGTGAAHNFQTDQINGEIIGVGTVTTSSGSTLVDGTGTLFSKLLKVGDTIKVFPPDNDMVDVFGSGAINITNNTISISNHGLTTGQLVTYEPQAGAAVPAGMLANYQYFVRATDVNTLILFNTLVDATNNTNPVDISSQGSGNHQLRLQAPSTPILRKVTAIGSDIQVTVNRPYTTTYTGVNYAFPTFVYVRPSGYSLHRPFDGGVEMSTGSQTAVSQIIRQTRKYFRYQSGKGIQLSLATNFKPPIDVTYVKKISDTVVEVRTRRPHGVNDGSQVTIEEAYLADGTLSESFNGTFTVSKVDPFVFTYVTPVPPEEDVATGFPRFYVTNWTGAAIRAGMFDFQNGFFYEFDGQKLYAVRRSSTQQISGSISAIQGSERILGTNTYFSTQLKVDDLIVLRGQSYKVASILSDTEVTIQPEYKGSNGSERIFNPQTAVNPSTDQIVIQNHGFSANLPIQYDAIDGQSIGGLINGRIYYADVIDSNTFKLKASTTSETAVNLSSTGTTTQHSFTPAKSGIIGTLTVDTKVPQEEWSIDVCDGTGITGYNLDLSKIQMCYMDYSWYGAGKIRFGFKGVNGEVVYTHEFTHNNHLQESYFRSGNLPCRYEVVNFRQPTFVPYLFHWGTSVIMDGRFDDDKAYLFTQSSQPLTIKGTTPKNFVWSNLNTSNDQINIPSHGFTGGDGVVYRNNYVYDPYGPQTTTGSNAGLNYLQNNRVYYIGRVDANNIRLYVNQADAQASSGVGNANYVDFLNQGQRFITSTLTPSGSSNNTSGAAYQPLLSIRLSPSVSEGLIGRLGDRDVINRMQMTLKQVGISVNRLADVKLLLNGRLNNLTFSNMPSPSLTQYISHSSSDTISGGVQVYNFKAAGSGGAEQTTTVDITDLTTLSNSILGGDSVYPDGPDILTVAVSRLTGDDTTASARLTWTEAQA